MKAPRLTRSLAPIRRLGLVALALSAIGSPSFADSTVEPVVWTELVGASAVGSTLAKTGSSGSWDAGGVSTKGIVSVDGYVEFVGEETGTSRMVGLSWGQTDAGYVDIDYALYLAGGSLQIYEGGVYRGSFGSWTRGDLFRVGVESGQVVYRRNGVELYRSLVAPRYPLLVDASLMNRGATVKDAVLGGVLERVAVGPPVLSVPSGVYGGPVTVVVTGEEGSALHYTEDGTEPTQESASLASGDGILVDHSLVLKVKAWAPGLLPSPVVEGRYQIGATATVEPVTWTNVVGADVSPGQLLKTGSSTGWDAGAASTKAIVSVNGYVEFSSSTSGNKMIGLSEGDSDAGYQDIDYALYLAGGVLQIYESGVYRGSFGSRAAGDRLRVGLEDGQVLYRRNGVELYRSLVAPRYPLLVDTSIGTPGSGVSGVVLGGVLESTLAATPELSPPPGRFELSVSVSVTSATPGATVRITLDGSEPGTSSPAVTGPITLEASATIRARAFRGDRFGSPTAVGVYEIGLPTAASPVATPPPGLYTAPVTVSLATATPGATIRFTTDGSDPEASAPVYSAPLSIDTASVLKARAFADGHEPSPVMIAEYTFNFGVLEAPSVNPPGGTYSAPVQVTLAGPPGAVIYYTLDGSEPTEASALYTVPLTFSTATDLRARAFKPSWSPSPVTQAVYEFDQTTVGTVAAGAYHSLAATPERMLWAWGANGTGQLGLGSITDTPVPTEVAGLTDVVAVAAGGGHTIVLRGDGTVWAAGSNAEGELGQAGDDSAVFQAVPGLGGVTQIVSGWGHVLALKADGTVAAWGYNGSGQLGNGTLDPSFAPVTIPGLSEVVAIAAGSEHSLALRSDGTVLAWGYNGSGQLGDGTYEDSTIPVAVSGVAGITRIASGSAAYHSLAVSADGTVFAWGANWSGQLGDGSSSDQSAPVVVSGLSGAVRMAAGDSHSLALKADGSLWVWGDNGNGQLGTGDTEARTTPLMLVSPTGLVGIAAGVEHSLALTGDGRVLSWGGNANGQLGTGGTGSFVMSPVELCGPGFEWQLIAPTITPSGGSFANELDAIISALTPDVTIHYTTDGSDPTEASPVIASGAAVHVAESMTVRARAWKEGSAPSTITTAVFDLPVGAPTANPPAGGYAGRVHVGLASETAQAEIHYTTDGTEPTLDSPPYQGLITLIEDTTVKARAFRGTGDTSATATFSYRIGPPVGAVAAGGAFSLALTPSGAVWAWGAGDAGQLGNGLGLGSPDPWPVEAVTDAVAIAAGTAHALALRVDGTVVAWGGNDSGQLGMGTTGESQLTPLAIPGLDHVVAIAAGGAHSLALRADGRVYSWGGNASGQLGDGSTDDRAVPALVADPANVVAVAAGESHSLALGADGRVWAWGENSWGQLGDGSGTAQPTPVEVLADAVAIAAGAHHSLAVAGDRSVWVWGYGSSGGSEIPVRLVGSVEGDNCGGGGEAAYDAFLSMTRASPAPQQLADEGCVEVPFADAIHIAGGINHSLATRGDERAWSWGWGGAGQLGTGAVWQERPVQIEGPQTVVDVAAGGEHSLALTRTGEVWAWGKNLSGQVGDGTNDNRWTPVMVAGAGFAWPVPRPRLSPPPGSYTAAVQVAMTVPNGYVARYTTDGSDPSEASAAYDSPVPVEGSLELRARAFDVRGRASAEAGGWYSVIFGTLEPPRFEPKGGPFVSGVTVTLTAAVGATIHYERSADGYTWSPAAEYTSPLAIEATATLRAWATKPDWSDSPRASETYTVHVAAPQLDPGPGHYPAGQLITLRSPTPGARLHYTTDGRSPTESDPFVDGEGTIALATFRLKVRAWKAGLVASPTITGDYGLLGDPEADDDDDGLSNAEEAALGTDPANPDTNGDGLLDGLAVAAGLSATNPDMDGDGVANAAELAAGTNPFLADTDGDGAADGVDCYPLDPLRTQCAAPQPGDVTPPVITLTQPPNAVLVTTTP